MDSMAWEYAQIRVGTVDDKLIVLTINGRIQDLVKTPASPFTVLNEMGREGWELVNTLTLLPPSPTAIGPRGLWEYTLKRPR
jgi:hypothetical protein